MPERTVIERKRAAKVIVRQVEKLIEAGEDGQSVWDERTAVYAAQGLLDLAGADWGDDLITAAGVLLREETKNDARDERHSRAYNAEIARRRAAQARKNFGHDKRKKRSA